MDPKDTDKYDDAPTVPKDLMLKMSQVTLGVINRNGSANDQMVATATSMTVALVQSTLMRLTHLGAVRKSGGSYTLTDLGRRALESGQRHHIRSSTRVENDDLMAAAKRVLRAVKAVLDDE